jgi:hypothetical protein
MAQRLLSSPVVPLIDLTGVADNTFCPKQRASFHSPLACYFTSGLPVVCLLLLRGLIRRAGLLLGDDCVDVQAESLGNAGSISWVGLVEVLNLQLLNSLRHSVAEA